MTPSPFLFNVVLVEPEIPSNTGNIGRTCVGFLSFLHLVGPLGFEISDKRLKRAGLDYWPCLSYKVYPHWRHFESMVKGQRIFYFSTKGTQDMNTIRFQKGDWLVFGSETRGLSASLLKQAKHPVLRIPFPGPVRSLNLANAVSIGVFEAFRQISSSFKKAQV